MKKYKGAVAPLMLIPSTGLAQSIVVNADELLQRIDKKENAA